MAKSTFITPVSMPVVAVGDTSWGIYMIVDGFKNDDYYTEIKGAAGWSSTSIAIASSDLVLTLAEVYPSTGWGAIDVEASEDCIEGTYSFQIRHFDGVQYSDEVTVWVTVGASAAGPPPTFTSYDDIVLDDDPVAFWGMNELSGSTIHDTANGHDGTLSGTVTKGAPSLAGTGSSLDWSTAVSTNHDIIVVDSHADFNITGSMSVEIWLHMDPNHAGSTVINHYNVGSGLNSWSVSAGQWTIQARYKGSDDSWYDIPCYPEVFLGGSRQGISHIVWVHDAENDEDRIYANGVLQATRTERTVDIISNPSGDIHIGNTSPGNTSVWQTRLDNTAIYDVALTTTQIEDHFAARTNRPTFKSGEVDTLFTGLGSHQDRLTVDANYIYSTYNNRQTIQVRDRFTGDFVRSISVTSTYYIYSLFVDEATNRLWVGLHANSYLFFGYVDLETDTLTKFSAHDTNGSSSRWPQDFAKDPDTGKIWAKTGSYIVDLTNWVDWDSATKFLPGIGEGQSMIILNGYAYLAGGSVSTTHWGIHKMSLTTGNTFLAAGFHYYGRIADGVGGSMEVNNYYLDLDYDTTTGLIYFTDSYCVRSLDPVTQDVEIVAGNPETAGYVDNTENSLAARFGTGENTVASVAAYEGVVYVHDIINNAVRTYSLSEVLGGAEQSLTPTIPTNTSTAYNADATAYYDEISEDGLFTMDLWTDDPIGDASSWVFQVFDWTSNTWKSTPKPGSPGVQQWATLEYGEIMIEQASTGHTGLPAFPRNEEDEAVGSATCALTYYANNNVDAEWNIDVDDEGVWSWGAGDTGDGEKIAIRVIDEDYNVSPVRVIRLSISPVYDPPDTPSPKTNADILSTREDVAKSATFTVLYPGDGNGDGLSSPPFTSEQLRYDLHHDASAAEGDTGWTDSITVYDISDGTTVAGVIGLSNRIVEKDDPDTVLTFTPAANWNGATEAGLRAYDGGDGIDSGVSGTRYVNIYVEAVNDPPSAPSTSTSTTVAEDVTWTGVYTWSDNEFDAGDPSYGNTLEVSVDGVHWDQSYYDAPGGVITVEDASDEDLTANIRYVPKGNWFGSTTFYVRAIDSDEARSASTATTLTYTAVEDVPSAPYPSRMPTVKKGRVASQTFTAEDPDGQTVSFEIRAVGGSWSAGAATLTGAGALILTGSEVAFTPSSGFTGAYEFEIRAKDPDGNYSAATTVRGVVQPRGTTVGLTHLVRSSASSILTDLGPMPLKNLKIVESLNGWGRAEGIIPSRSLKARADDLGTDWETLLAAWSTEIGIEYDGAPRFVGPLTEAHVTSDGAGISVQFEGLGSYLDARRVETSGGSSYVGVEQSAIIWDLINDSQNEDYGDLLLTDSTTNTSENRAIDFKQGSVVSIDIEEIIRLEGGPEMWITSDREVETAIRRGSDLTGSILFTEGNSREIDVMERETTMGTVVIVAGDTHVGTAEADASVLAQYGRVVRHFEASYLTTQTQVDDAAAALLEEVLDPLTTVQWTHVVNSRSPIKAFDYEIGDVVQVEFDTRVGRISKAVRIVRREISFSNTSEQEFSIRVIAEEQETATSARLAREGYVPRDWAQINDLLYNARTS